MSDAVRHFARDRYVPIRDAIAPANHGDAHRHGIVRAAFLSLLNQDARVLLRFADWARTGGLLPRMGALQGALRALGFLVPLPPGIRASELPERLEVTPDMVRAFEGALAGSELMTAPAGRELLTRLLENVRLGGVIAPPPAVGRALAAVRVADRALTDRLAAVSADRGLGAAICQDAVAFVKELGTPWPWLATELVTQYVHWVLQARLYNARSAELLHSGVAPAPTGALPRGKLPNKDEETLKRYALWFFRVRVQGEEIRAVAREEFGPEAVDDRARDVRGGVRRAEALLALGLFRFPAGSP